MSKTIKHTLNTAVRLVLVMVLCLAAVPVRAQTSSMTDKQVEALIVSEMKKGTKQQEIVTRLMESGVGIDQVRRVRNKLQRERRAEEQGNPLYKAQDEPRSRIRKPNGDQRQPEKGKGVKLSDVEQAQYVTEIGEWQADTLLLQQEDEEEVVEKSRIFGHDIFNNKNLTFEPEMNIATPADYRLGAGDAVFVDVYGATHKQIEATVSPEGCIDIEGFGPVQVAGLSVQAAQARLRSQLGARYGGSQVRLSVGQTKTITVSVMGNVRTPGTFTLSAFSTVFHALYMAGGPDEIGTLRNIKVFRGGREVTQVDVYDYILGGKLSGNVRLSSGDVIYVGPYECLVTLSGKVKRPMLYEMKHTESAATAISYAGGFTGDAYQDNVTLVRKSGGRYSVYSLTEFDRSAFQLTDGDSISVDSVLNRWSNMVEVKGAVQRPGMYQMDGEISTVRALLAAAGGMTEDALTARAVMHRRKEDRTLEVLALDARGVMDHTVPDVALRNEDVLFIPSQEDLRSEQVFTITGEVYNPGRYEYAENTSVEDLILRAGGLTEAASLMKVDVARRVKSNKATEAGENIAENYSFKVKDGFVVDGDPGFVLLPYDEVMVRRSPGYVEQEHVTVQGEVNFEGRYVINRRNMRLSDLIKACGGLSKEAYARGARLERLLTPFEQQRQKQMVRMLQTGEDSVNMDRFEISTVRYVGIDLSKAVEHPGNDEWDIVLLDGDKLIVPQYNNTVSVNGEVLYPNTVAYKEGAKLNYYLNQAGGYSDRAKRSKVFAINMNGTVTRVKSAKDIQPGAEIIVPSKPKRQGMSLASLLQLGMMTASLGSIVAALIK